jgi:hypothetical protein
MQTEQLSPIGNQAVNRLQQIVVRQQAELQAKERREQRIMNAVRQVFGPDGYDLVCRIIKK